MAKTALELLSLLGLKNFNFHPQHVPFQGGARPRFEESVVRHRRRPDCRHRRKNRGRKIFADPRSLPDRGTGGRHHRGGLT